MDHVSWLIFNQDFRLTKKVKYEFMLNPDPSFQKLTF